MTQTELVETMARALAPHVCRPVYNGDADDVAQGQDHARYVAGLLAPFLDQAHRAGEVAMRERAGEVANEGYRIWGEPRCNAAQEIATAISALEPEGMGDANS